MLRNKSNIIAQYSNTLVHNVEYYKSRIVFVSSTHILKDVAHLTAGSNHSVDQVTLH